MTPGGTGVELDTSALERAARQLAASVGSEGPRVGMAEAQTSATRIRGLVPRRSGRLAASVRAVSVSDGGTVEYGSGVPYARYIEHRSHAVTQGLAGAPERYGQAQHQMLEREAGRL